MEKAKKILGYIFNKYTIVLIAFLLLMFFGEKHNFIKRIRYKHTIHELEKEIDQYTAEIERNKEKMQQLRSDKKDIERFAREQHLMKSPDEDVFVVK